MARSEAQDANMDVSVWLNETAFIVSIAVGQLMVCVGTAAARVTS